MTWTQVYDPLGHWWLSTLVAALPIVVLLGLLAGLKVRPHWCATAGAAVAVLCAIFIFGMPAQLAVTSLFYGIAFGLLKIVWIVLAAVFLYDISVATGQFEIMKHSVASITPDRRLQLLLVAFCFGAFIEGAAGFGAPVAIAGAFMIGLGFRPFHAAALNLIANTAPVAWGAIGIPVHTLAVVTNLPDSELSAMIGRILPITAVLVPFWLVRAMVSWSETFEVLPAILVVGVSFGAMQFFWSNYMDSNLVDIVSAVTSLLAALVFLRFWKPKRVWRFEEDRAATGSAKTSTGQAVGPVIRDVMDDEWDLVKFSRELRLASTLPRKSPRPGCLSRSSRFLFSCGACRRSRMRWAAPLLPLTHPEGGMCRICTRRFFARSRWLLSRRRKMPSTISTGLLQPGAPVSAQPSFPR